MDERWLSVLARVTPLKPVDLDPITSAAANPLPTDADTEFMAAIPVTTPPSARLWERMENDLAYLGIRVTEPLSDTAAAAIRLASAALERGISPIILTTQNNSGFERFGFRVERIDGATKAERDRHEEELKRFWNMAIVIDAADVVALG